MELDDNMIVEEEEPYWSENLNTWMYPIVDKANPSPETNLKIYTK